MITKERFNEIKPGDFITLISGDRPLITRKVIRITNTQYLVFKKIRRGDGETYYCYSDVAHKIVAIFKPKK